MPRIPFTSTRLEPSGPRGPSPATPLSRARLDTSGGPTLLSAPILRAPSGGIRIPQLNARAGMVNANAGMLKPRRVIAPEETAPQYRDMVGPAVADAGYALGKAGMAYAVRQDELAANEGNLLLAQKVRELKLGYTDANGYFVQGYMATKGKEASEGYGGYESELNTLRQQIYDSMPNRDAGARFLAKSVNVVSGALNEGAAHAATGTRVWEGEQLNRRSRQLSIELADNAMNPAMVDQKLKQAEQDITATLGADKAEASIQGFYQRHADYLASQPMAVVKLNAFKSVIGGRATQETMTQVDGRITEMVRVENTERRQAEAETDRNVRDAREARGIQLRSQLWEGKTIPETELHTMLKARQIDGSTHDYLIYVQREGRNIAPLSGSEISDFKRDIRFGEMDSANIDQLGLNAQDNKSLHQYLVTNQDQKTNRDLRSIWSEIDRMGKNPLNKKGEHGIASAGEAAERLYLHARVNGKPISPYEAVQRGTAGYITQEVIDRAAPPQLEIDGAFATPLDEGDLDRLLQEWKRTADLMPNEERKRQARLFKLWAEKFATDKKQLTTRQAELEGTAQP